MIARFDGPHLRRPRRPSGACRPVRRRLTSRRANSSSDGAEPTSQPDRSLRAPRFPQRHRFGIPTGHRRPADAAGSRRDVRGGLGSSVDAKPDAAARPALDRDTARGDRTDHPRPGVALSHACPVRGPLEPYRQPHRRGRSRTSTATIIFPRSMPGRVCPSRHPIPALDADGAVQPPLVVIPSSISPGLPPPPHVRRGPRRPHELGDGQGRSRVLHARRPARSATTRCTSWNSNGRPANGC